MIKTADKYIVTNFILPFILSLFFFVFMMHVIEYFDRMEFFSTNKINFFKLVFYFICRSPFFMVEFMPVAVLFAAIFSLSEMSRRNELIILLATGVSFFRIIRPLILLGVSLFAFVALFNDIVVPPASAKASRLNDEFHKSTSTAYNFNINRYGKKGIAYSISSFDPVKNTLNAITVIKFGHNNELIYRLDAEKAVWDSGLKSWLFVNGDIKFFTNNRILSSKNFSTNRTVIYETPADFKREDKAIQDMNIRDAWGFIQRLKSSGSSYSKELVEFNWKFSFPFGVVIMILIGAPLSAYSRRNAFIMSCIFSLIGAFVFYSLLYLGASLGKNEVLPPLFAAWIGNVIFGGITWVLIRKAKT